MDETNESELQSNLQKCRCCFRMLIDDRKAIKIDEIIKNQFFCLTQIELLSLDIFAARICELCKVDLQTFSDLRKDLVSKQTSLYELAGIDINEQNDTQEELIEDYEMIESLSRDSFKNEEEIIFEEVELMDEPNYEEATEESDVLKIEKLDKSVDDNEDSTEYFINYFEEAKDESSTLQPISNELESEICEVCDVEVLKGYLNEHIELIHGDEISCDKCCQKFKSKILLKKHIIDEHTTDSKNRKNRRKLHYCPLCMKQYDYKKQLVDHIRSFHKKERNTECPICKRRFYHRDLKKHMQHVHGEKKIACEVCGKLYTCLENLKLHLRYHEDPKYICSHENCGKKFHQKALWEHHMLKHKNERNISCSECNFSCYTLRDLKRHSQRVHNKVTRKCFGCEMVFHRKDKYREHVLKNHKELSDESRSKILEQIKQLKWHEN